MTFFDFGEKIDHDSKFAIFGIPWDYLTSIKIANSAIAPKKIRDVTLNIALITELGLEIPTLKAVDLGDIMIKPKAVEQNIKNIDNFINEIYNQKSDIIPVMIGGDHFCTYPVLKAVSDQSKDKEHLGVLIFDSHLDFYNSWDKGVYSHATVSRRIYDLEAINNKSIMIAGARDIDIAELESVKENNVSYLNAYLLQENGLDQYINSIISFFNKSEIDTLYLSIDIDVLDPSVAPATGYAIPGGLSYRELWYILKKVTEHFRIIAFDLVEVSPNLDLPNNMTSILAAKLIIELISFITLKK
ncbi:MAG: arginase family protein [Candidatus Hermodarchaeota archaeon]